MCFISINKGEKLTDEEVDSLFSSVEDTAGHINYEGWFDTLYSHSFGYFLHEIEMLVSVSMNNLLKKS